MYVVLCVMLSCVGVSREMSGVRKDPLDRASVRAGPHGVPAAQVFHPSVSMEQGPV